MKEPSLDVRQLHRSRNDVLRSHMRNQETQMQVYNGPDLHTADSEKWSKDFVFINSDEDACSRDTFPFGRRCVRMAFCGFDDMHCQRREA